MLTGVDCTRLGLLTCFALLCVDQLNYFFYNMYFISADCEALFGESKDGLAALPSNMLFDRIIFNFPHTGCGVKVVIY